MDTREWRWSPTENRVINLLKHNVYNAKAKNATVNSFQAVSAYVSCVCVRLCVCVWVCACEFTCQCVWVSVRRSLDLAHSDEQIFWSQTRKRKDGIVSTRRHQSYVLDLFFTESFINHTSLVNMFEYWVCVHVSVSAHCQCVCGSTLVCLCACPNLCVCVRACVRERKPEN